MTANRNCSYRGRAILSRVLAIFMRIVLLIVFLPPIALAQSPEQKAALAEAARLNAEGEKLYRAGKYSEIEPLYRRSLGIREKVLGPEHPDVATSLNNLAVLYYAQGQFGQAEPLYRRSLGMWEKVLGPEHPDVATSLNNLAGLYDAQGRYAEAEPLYRRSLAIKEKALGPEHPGVALSLNNLAGLYHTQGRYAEAEPHLRRSLGIREKVLGPEHPEVATSLNNLAYLLAGREPTLARPLYERARRIQLAVGRVNIDLDEEALRGLLESGRGGLREYAKTLAAIARDAKLDSSPGSAPMDAFVVAEQVRGGSAHAALAKASARISVGDPATADLARQVQDLRNQRQVVGKQLIEEYGKSTQQRNAQRLEALQKETQKLDRELKEAVDHLNQAFPKFAELASPEPIDVVSVQRLLGSDEALVSYFTLDDRLLVWFVRPGREPVYKDISVKKADLTKLVERVRTSLDQSQNPDLSAGRFVPFDVAGSHELFKFLLTPLTEHLAAVKRLIVVPDDVLLPLPFGALLSRSEGEPYRRLASLYNQKATPSPKDLADYAKLSWLAREYAITVLPSATSLRALRQIPRVKEKEIEPLIAFGDPALRGVGRERGGTMLASRGIGVPVEEIRSLNRLPGTRDELLAVAKALGADPSKALYLAEQATKPILLGLNASGRLGRAQVVSFATHGLIGGELKGLKEPALVLTPPDQPSEQDNGPLGLEDILTLKLNNADWVILSACNTAAADGSSEGLSGLVRAFFFAGTPSLLVSHWSVEDRATQALMTEVFQRYARDKTMARSEALRQGMLALMAKAKGDTAYLAHPFAWAPFFLVGEGSN